MRVSIKNIYDLMHMRENGVLLSQAMGEVAKWIKPGITTKELDNIGEAYIRDHNAVPAFMGYGPKKNPFPSTLCISINDEVVHGIPLSTRVLKEGDIVSIDCGLKKNNYYVDMAYTYGVGEILDRDNILLKTTYDALFLGIRQCIHGRMVGDISNAIQKRCEMYGFGVIKELVGHGVGKQLHEEPQIPNWGTPGSGMKLKQGMTIAIEPMVTLGDSAIRVLDDGWTISTKDRLNSAHYEHTVYIGENKPEPLTTFKYIEQKVLDDNDSGSDKIFTLECT